MGTPAEHNSADQLRRIYAHPALVREFRARISPKSRPCRQRWRTAPCSARGLCVLAGDGPHHRARM